jgi:hypothetical protein
MAVAGNAVKRSRASTVMNKEGCENPKTLHKRSSVPVSICSKIGKLLSLHVEYILPAELQPLTQRLQTCEQSAVNKAKMPRANV